MKYGTLQNESRNKKIGRKNLPTWSTAQTRVDTESGERALKNSVNGCLGG